MSSQTQTTDNRPYALELSGVTKNFAGLLAVNNVTLTIREGERRAIIGPNGAGKTTLFNLISGELPITSGTVTLFGKDVTKVPAHQRVGLGLGRTYQITKVFKGLTVEQNVLLAVQGLMSLKFNMWSSLLGKSAIRDKAHQLMAMLNLLDQADIKVKELSYGEQRQLEIALALATDPKVLLLDEPAAGLSPADRVLVADVIRKLPSSLTIVLIEHDMGMALSLVESVACLHYGELIAEGRPEDIRQNETVQEIYLGVR